MGRKTSRDLESELTRAEEESEHWKVTCLVLRHHYTDLKNKYIECKEQQVKKKGFEGGFEKKKEISELDGEDANVIVYKRRRKNRDIKEDDELRDKCECVHLKWEIDALKYEKQKAIEEIEGLQNECLDLEVQGDLLKMRCKQLIKKTVVIEKEASEREKSRQERINCLEKECVQLNREVEYLKLGKKRDAGEIEDLRMKVMELEIEETVSLDRELTLGKELEDCRNKCQGLSAELVQKETELKNLLAINGGLDHQSEEYRTKCTGLEEHIKGLMGKGILMYDRERSLQERICVLEEVIEKLESKEIERCVQLNTENRNLENGNRKAEDDKIDSLTKRFTELETRLF
ncbi:tropomyosin beta chain-like [Papaver somniferum]|uniref:tropomyosin beta chain-like n=1 Tax=Papaver somniferum TaxID=3469 RepID=UPI000E6F5AAF|nr:tropomyosin beta chain-like [Papaver somniferum]